MAEPKPQKKSSFVKRTLQKVKSGIEELPIQVKERTKRRKRPQNLTPTPSPAPIESNLAKGGSLKKMLSKKLGLKTRNGETPAC